MAYYNNNNTGNGSYSSNKDKAQVSTNGGFRGTCGNRSQQPCALRVGYFDDRVRLSFAPELPKDMITQERRYDYDNELITALTREKCNELCNIYTDVIRPAIKNGEDATAGITVATVNMIQIGTGLAEDGKLHPFIAFYKGIDEDTLIAPKDSSVKYEFNTGEYIVGYNPDTGEFKDRIITCNEIDLFFHDLMNSRNATSNAYIHTDRVVNRYWKETLDGKLNQIGSANGLDLAYKPKYSNTNGGKGSIFENQSGYHGKDDSNQMVESEVAHSIDDIDRMVGGVLN